MSAREHRGARDLGAARGLPVHGAARTRRSSEHDARRLGPAPGPASCSSASPRRCSGSSSPRSTTAARAGSTACSGRSSGSSTASAASTRSASSAGTSTRSRCSRSASSSFFLLYAMQRFQGSLPFNPTDVAGVTPGLSFNTAVSFVTNTNWQSYYPETTVSHLTQMVGLTVQNFVSAAVGMAVMAALIRGLARVGQAHDRQLLGRPRAHDAADPAPALDRVRGRSDRQRRDPEHPRLPRGHDRRRARSR